jgi:hypothetical protein
MHFRSHERSEKLHEHPDAFFWRLGCDKYFTRVFYVPQMDPHVLTGLKGAPNSSLLIQDANSFP